MMLMSDIERITVSLIPQASAALAATLSRSGLSKTDVVNRAVTLYDFITERVSEGDEIVLASPGGQQKAVKFL